ncbi:MAG: hypothetical protein FJ299_16915, partial [Planctomycetes bacterium]|nr:hypothetical protein [Planctomycetota bacterium]
AREGALDPRAEPWHRIVRDALRERTPRALELGVVGTLRVHWGDARRELPALAEPLRYDAVFLDPFSPRRQAELWEPAFLAEVARRMAVGAWLSTYTVSKPVRRALGANGLRVLPGPAVGRKREGTLAERPGA